MDGRRARAAARARRSVGVIERSLIETAAGVIMCVALLASATAATLADHEPAVGTVPVRIAAAAPAARTNPVPRMQLDAAVHPAADYELGARWTVSRRLIIPVAGVLPDELVDTFNQGRGPNRRHEAIDIGAPRGAAVLAVTDGVVLRLTEHDSGGITLYLLAPDGQTMFYYAHLLKYADGVRAGAAVRQGDVIGFVGDTGNAGPGNYHLHFEVMSAPDPRQFHAARPWNPYPLLLRSRG